jgi:hypothetical protein
MEKIEIKNRYRVVSGETLVSETNSLPKLAKQLGCDLSWIYKFKPRTKSEGWYFNLKGYRYQIITLS